MFPDSYFPGRNKTVWGSYFPYSYFPKSGQGGFIPPPVVSGQGNQLLTLVGVGSAILLAIISTLGGH